MGGVVRAFFLHLSFSFSLPLGDGLIETEIASQRAVKPQNSPPTNHLFP